MTYIARLNEASLFVEFFNSTDISLLVKAGSLKTAALKDYFIDLKAIDECDIESEDLTIDIKLTDSAIASQFEAKLLALDK